MIAGSRIASFLAVGLLISAGALSAQARTLRLDYFHTGNARREIFSLDRVVREPLPWPGNPNRPLDHTNLGKYFFQVIDRATNSPLYSRGFSSIYGEWETTPEAKRVNRTFQESLRFPEPAAPVQIVLKKRDAENAFREVWSLTLDPADIFIDPSLPSSPGPLIAVQESGPPPQKVDLLLVGDGYRAAERGKCEGDVRRLAGILFSKSPFRERKSDFNIWALCPPSPESGISRPSDGRHRRSALGATYDAFGSERYILTFDNRALRETAAFAPYEFIEILANGKTYGGGGIFNLFATVAVDSDWAPYVFIHEFGHHFAGLADEYYTSPVAYGPSLEHPEPWEPNVTAHPERTRLKWRDLVEKKTPLPTPWQKQVYEQEARRIQVERRKIRAEGRPESEMNALFRQQQEWETRLFSAERYGRMVGAFEGAMYQAQGYYRPQVDCIMFSRNPVPFCRVCRRAIARVIDLYSR